QVAPLSSAAAGVGEIYVVDEVTDELVLVGRVVACTGVPVPARHIEGGERLDRVRLVPAATERAVGRNEDVNDPWVLRWEVGEVAPVVGAGLTGKTEAQPLLQLSGLQAVVG